MRNIFVKKHAIVYRSSTEYKYNALVTNAAELCWIWMGLRNFGIEMLLHKMGCHIRLNGYIIAKYFKLFWQATCSCKTYKIYK